MTRGKIAVVLQNKLLKSVEFNGDMYIEQGHGTQVLDELKGVTNEQEYRDFIEAFDSENFNYATESKQDGENYFDNDYYKNGVGEVIGEEQAPYFNFCENYFEYWFSDYVYIKNLTDKDITITCSIERNKEEIKFIPVRIEPNGIVALNFGTLVEKYGQGYEVMYEGATNLENIDEQSFDGYWEMTENGIVIYDTDNDRIFGLTEVDDCTINHIVDYIKEGYVRGDLFEVYLERV